MGEKPGATGEGRGAVESAGKLGDLLAVLRRSWVTTLLLVGFFLAGLVLGLDGVRRQQLAKESQSWPTATATVTGTGLEGREVRYGRTRRTVWVATVKASFEHRGRARASVSHLQVDDEDAGKRLLASFPEGGACTVRFPPGDPFEASVFPPDPGPPLAWVCLWFTVAVVSLGLIVWKRCGGEPTAR